MLAEVLQVIGVSPGRVPAEQADGAALCRSALANRPVLVVADEDGLASAVRHGFVEFDHYVLDCDTTAYVDLYLAN